MDMDKSAVEVDAARRLMAALDTYQVKFKAMVDASMDVAIYEEVSACLGDIRAAKTVIFSQVAPQSVDFVLAHTSLMTSLWNARLAQIRGHDVPFLDLQSETLSAEHDEAVEQLRAACQKVIRGKRVPDAPKPSPSPNAGA
jgi:hypothetical protein